ncbi:hypothetical protein GLOIN_2v1478737 [Rhizophagus irregularis DAOM 181602=DAOM 197198]|nr:hypothetical protein GLOIN_2v1478737 [Rhizophagus irregularis DAOM 181602=DAOM 197198]
MDDSDETFIEADEDQEFNLKSLISHFFKVFVESSKAHFHLMLIPNCWYKDEYMSSSDPCSGEVIKSNCDINGYDELLQFIKEFNRRKEAQQAQEEAAKQQEALANRKMTTNDNKVLYGNGFGCLALLTYCRYSGAAMNVLFSAFSGLGGMDFLTCFLNLKEQQFEVPNWSLGIGVTGSFSVLAIGLIGQLDQLDIGLIGLVPISSNKQLVNWTQSNSN